MTHQTARHSLLLIAMLTSLLPGSRSTAQDEHDDSQEIPKLTARGEAEITVPADQLRISIGVTTEHAEAQEAVKQNATQMTNVMKALERAGVEGDEIKTGRFNLRPQYARRPRQPEEGWTPSITGYQVVNTVTITSKRLDEAGAMIDAASKAGSNTIDEIAFELADEQQHRAEAIEKATRNAIQDASAMARAANVRVKRVLRLNLDSAGSNPTPIMARRGALAAMESDPNTPITPGDVTIRASVTVVYEIEVAE